MNKKILIISMIILVITLIGSTYAFFIYSKTTKAFTLTSGDIDIQFVNGDNNINLTYAYPISDNYAKDNLEKLGYIDFSVNGNITEDKKVINYEIYLEEDSKNTLDSNYIKVYLTDDTNKEIVSPKIYNSLDKTSYSNSTNGKVIYKVSKHGEFNDKYRIYVWIDSKYSQNIIQESFSFKVNLYAYNDNETAVSVIKSKLVKYEESSKEDFQGGLVAVNTDGDLYNETDSSESIREYRYSGPNVNNYVTFNNEEWRIIGVFKDEDGNENVKIVRNEVLPANILPDTYNVNEKTFLIRYSTSHSGGYFDYDGTNYDNNWSDAGLMYWLNSKGLTNGYLKILSSDAQSMITETKYYLGTLTYNTDVYITDTPEEAYKYERAVAGCVGGKGPSINNSSTAVEKNSNCRVWADHAATWTGKIGLLYPSDYGLAISNSYWNTKMTKDDFSTIAINNNWLKKDANSTNHEWFLSPSSSSFTHVVHLHANGYVGWCYTRSAHGIRPTLYLKSNVKIVSGDGTQDNQYKLALD